MNCAVTHPERLLRCGLEEGNHEFHAAFVDGEWVDWPNPDFVAPRPRHSSLGWQQRMNEIASHTDRPIVRSSDPDSAHLAAERIQPRRGTRKAMVLEVLSGGEWIDGTVIATAEVGGSEGLRRLRELRDDGWVIEERPHPTSATAWQYRLVSS